VRCLLKVCNLSSKNNCENLVGWKSLHSEGVVLPTGDCIRSLCPWRNLQEISDVLENCGISHNQIRQDVSCEYKRS